MKKIALLGLGLVGGFAAAMFALPEARGANDTSAYSQLDLFSDAFERVRANYVRPVKDSELIDAAIQGMVSNLDPHSSYMDAKMYGDMEITTGYDIVLAGLGRVTVKPNDQLLAGEPVGNMPPDAAGERLYFELRHGGHGQSPAPWLKLNLRTSFGKANGT